MPRAASPVGVGTVGGVCQWSLSGIREESPVIEDDSTVLEVDAALTIVLLKTWLDMDAVVDVWKVVG